MFTYYMIKIFLHNDLHHKNKNALFKYKNIEIVQDARRLGECNIIYSPSDTFTSSTDKPIVYGPHFSVFPDHKINIIKNQNCVYVQPSEWALNVWKNNFDICQNLNMHILPFGVDTDKFSPNQNLVQKNKCFLYYKRRNPTELAFLTNILINNHIEYKIFKYGEYNENDYVEYLKTCEFGFWLDAHESQGFALEEALSMNVPLLVWNVKFMSQEYGSNYQNFETTTIPYWSEQCGEYIYEQCEFAHKYKLFMSKLKTYEPRQYILNNLSMEICEQKLIKLINNF